MLIVPKKSLVSPALSCLFALSVTTTAYAQAVSKSNHSRKDRAATKTITTLPERQAKVFVGSSDEGGLPTAWEELANPDNYSKWNYVRTHADGFYTNFAMMDHVFAHGANPLQMSINMANAFTRKDVFYETDMNYPEAQDLRNIKSLTSGGFNIPFTSLNYGISAKRVQMLKNYQGKRECLALMGPWTLGGDVLGNAPGNAALRKNIKATDGMSADSPLRLWYNNDQSTREGLHSTVTFTNQLNKISAVMLAPPDSNDRPGYGGPSFLKSSQMMVFDLEDHHAVPAIWGVYPYGALTSLAAFPESVVNAQGDTVAPDTKTGVAYWLIKHFNTFPKVTLLGSGVVKKGAQVIQKSGSHATVSFGKAKPGNAKCTMPFVISNGFAPGIAISPVIRAIISHREGWDVQFKLRGKNVTNSVVSDGGFNFVGGARISKKNPSTLQISIHAKKGNPKPVTIQLQTMSNISNTVKKEISFTIVAKVQKRSR
ncbi:hypothetical protein B1R32_13413 [Abditibacterium utsteinense]|uniref:Uncharacterized protein n=1 Tax=Abditibacterium utsteinense TaxID=1960156 RepID=A0A2S8SNS9_9BACT|nr:hypothetical protein [Abditibacterium utsteinense]PQV62455.1 hypothetical protein B1R32_13413 [Abditibacterium utsteinense]